jgi:ferrochelatase
LRELTQQGVKDVVIVPVGFLSDHVEVLFDLDVEARREADSLGINMVRAKTVGTHPAMIAMIRELILERVDSAQPQRAMGCFGPSPNICPVDCCLPRA